MIVAANGAAIIAGEVVPATEMKTLRALVSLQRPATVAEVRHALNDQLSEASLYSLLRRLHEKRGLAQRQVASVMVYGTSLRRVLWNPTDAAVLALAPTTPAGAVQAQPSHHNHVHG